MRAISLQIALRSAKMRGSELSPTKAGRQACHSAAAAMATWHEAAPDARVLGIEIKAKWATKVERRRARRDGQLADKRGEPEVVVARQEVRCSRPRGF